MRDRIRQTVDRVTEPPLTRYAQTPEGTYLAYQVSGDGPIDLIVPVTGSAATELIWDEPAFSAFVSRLASFSRLITFDPRGFGSSGRLDPAAIPAVQTWKDDIVSIMDVTAFRARGVPGLGRGFWCDDVLRRHQSRTDEKFGSRQRLRPLLAERADTMGSPGGAHP